MINQWRELPLSVPPAAKFNCQDLHQLVASMTKAQQNDDPNSRAYIAGYDMIGPGPAATGRTLILRYRQRADLDLPGVPLLPFKTGQRIQFHISAHIEAHRVQGKRGLVIFDPRDRILWLGNRQQDIGLDIHNVDISESLMRPIHRKGRSGNIYDTRFTGIATIVDDEKFARAVISGIGRQKSYGFGLIQYRHITNS
jgi:hypothetical protein